MSRSAGQFTGYIGSEQPKMSVDQESLLATCTLLFRLTRSVGSVKTTACTFGELPRVHIAASRLEIMRLRTLEILEMLDSDFDCAKVRACCTIPSQCSHARTDVICLHDQHRHWSVPVWKS